MARPGHKERQPAQKRYTSEQRWTKNKARRAARRTKQLATAAAKGVHARKVAERFAEYRRRMEAAA